MSDIKLFENKENINLIIKTAGNACNINCSYCFEKVKEVDKKYITANQLENILEKVNGTCSVVFHGGEPLIIGVEKFDDLLNVVQRFYPQKVIAVRIQTNGTLLNDKWIELFYKKYDNLNIEIAISLDGTRIMNCHRVDYTGKETYDDIKGAFTLLEKHGKKAGMLSVISRQALTEVDKYIELLFSIPNLSFVKMNALFNIEDGKLTEDSITPMQYAQFIYEVACRYVETGLYRRIAIEPILSILQRINNRKSRYCNYSERKCFNYLSVYPDGSVGPCDCFSVNEFMVFNVNKLNTTINDVVCKYIEKKEITPIQKLIEACKKCDIVEFCKSGCLSQRYYFEGNDSLQNDFCKSKHFLYDKFKMFNLAEREG